MASDTDEEVLHDSGGTMSAADLSEHLRTWHGFLSFIKWLVIGNVALLAFLAAFRTHN